jgi:hypothetical protein
MRVLATATCAIALLVWSSPAAAQAFGFGARAGVSIPLGDYAQTTDGVGFSGGLDFTLPLAMVTPALSWYTSADAVGHSVDSNAVAGASGGYLHIPLLTGLRFDVGALGAVRPFATGQVGAVFARGPTVGQVSPSTTTNLGFGLGGGLQLTPNWYAGAKWVSGGDVAVGNQTEAVRYVDVYVGFGVR